MSTGDDATDTASAPRLYRDPWWAWAALLLILGFAAFVRIRLIDLPLERDEGEYAYAGQLLLQGIPPYDIAYNMKLPGTYAAYALIMGIFGQTTGGIHLGLIVINSLNIVLVYFLGRSLFGRICGVVGAASFALLSLSDSVFGLAAHATHFVTLFATAGALCLWHYMRNARPGLLFWSGLLMGISFLMKQQAIFFVAFGAVMVLVHEFKRPSPQMRNVVLRAALFGVGAALPFFIACILLAFAGVFPRFWFWTFSYARQYASFIPYSLGLLYLEHEILNLLRSAPVLWILFVVACVFVWLHARERQAALFAGALLCAAFASACPGLFFREHYFIPMLPAVGIFLGAAVQIISDQDLTGRKFKWETGATVVLLLGAFGQAVLRHQALFFHLSPDAAARYIYGNNPFPESPQIARYIREHSKPEDRIAVLGSEPQIYFYSRRHSATGYIYIYPLMEPQKYAATMQGEMIAQIETARPEFIVFVNVPASWLAQPNSSRAIFSWVEGFCPRYYRSVGLVETGYKEASIPRWGDRAVAAIPRSDTFVRVFQRNDLF